MIDWSGDDPVVVAIAIPDADARAHYRAVVARVEALVWMSIRVDRGERIEGWRPLNDDCLRALRRIRCGAVQQLRALGERC